MELINLFIGHDPREAVGVTVFCQSVFERTCLAPVAITRLMNAKGDTVNDRDGTNMFTYQRFLVPWLMGFKGFAIFADGADMLLRHDLAELMSHADHFHAVKVVKHDYKTRWPVKYIGTPMEASNQDYPRKNWSSVILWNCAHYQNRVLTPDYVSKHDGNFLHRFKWIQDAARIGDLPREWNVLVGETLEPIDAKIAHYTLGIPGFKAYRGADYSDEWFDTLARAQDGLHLEAR